MSPCIGQIVHTHTQNNKISKHNINQNKVVHYVMVIQTICSKNSTLQSNVANEYAMYIMHLNPSRSEANI